MKYKRLLQFGFFLSSAFAAFLVQSTAFGSDALIDRDGRTFEVKINGTATTREAPTKIRDSAGTEAFEVFWSAKVAKGPLCFSVEVKDQRLGKPEKINILIHEIRPDRPMQRWKSYDTVPPQTDGMADFQTAKGYCPSEYTLTDRLRYPALPPGDYVMRVAYWGVGNWDRQDIRVTIPE